MWFPTNVLIIRSLLQHYAYYGDDFTIECPTGSGNQMTLFEVSQELSRRLISIFRRGEDGRRPVYGGTTIFQEDEHWRDHVLFYEYFHGDNGAGLGASHQTGWTGLVARLIQLTATVTAEDVLREGRKPLARPYRRLTGEPMAGRRRGPGDARGQAGRRRARRRHALSSTTRTMRAKSAPQPIRPQIVQRSTSLARSAAVSSCSASACRGVATPSVSDGVHVTLPPAAVPFVPVTVPGSSTVTVSPSACSSGTPPAAA